MARATKAQQEALDRALDLFEESIDFHANWIKGVDRRSDAYHAIKDTRKDPSYSGWRNAHFAPYVMHIVDSTLASMVEDKLRYKIRARPTLEDLQDPLFAERAEVGTRAHQILFDWQNRQTKFTRIQRPLLLQNSIAQLTVAKTIWSERVERRRRVVAEESLLLDDNDQPIIDPISGMPKTYVDLKTVTKATTVYDGPETDVVDVHDFFWDKGATSMKNARWVAQRSWMTKEDLEAEFGDDGMFGPDNGGWSRKKALDVLATDANDEGDRDDSGNRWSQKGEPVHDWKRIEVIEMWDFRTRMVTVFASRRSLLAHKPFPFHHERSPFTVCTTQPDLFSFTGISQVEKVMALQDLLHKIQNQSVDNLELINNAIVIFNPALENAASLPFYPGAAWPVEDPDLVQMWAPNPIPAEISLNREGILKGDMQNVAATFPFSSGAESQTVDQKTATGASIVSNLAQRSIDMAKQPVYDMWEDIGNDRIVLNQQFISEEMAIPVLGLDGKESYEEILPELLGGDYEYEQEPIPDALIKQQEQAKATGLLQGMMQVAPLVLPLAQAGIAKMINMDAVIEYYLKSLDIENTDQFFISKPPAQAAVPSPGQPQQPTAGQDPNLGITHTEPGMQTADDPSTHLARAGALSGGGVNVAGA
jgi:hypothetical protein